MTRRQLGALRVAAGALAAGLFVVAWTSPAEAKFPPFELGVSTTHLEVRETVRLAVTLEGEWADEVFATVVPSLVHFYRTTDLPTSGIGVGTATAVAEVSFTSDRALPVGHRGRMA